MQNIQRSFSSFSSSDVIALCSLAMVIISFLWNVFYGYGRLSTKVEAMQGDIVEIKVNMIRLEDKMERRFEKIENRLDQMEETLHQLDSRVIRLEERKP